MAERDLHTVFDNLPDEDDPLWPVAPRGETWFQRYPLVWRFGVVVLAFLLLIPVSRLFADDSSGSVDASGLPSAAESGVGLRETDATAAPEDPTSTTDQAAATTDPVASTSGAPTTDAVTTTEAVQVAAAPAAMVAANADTSAAQPAATAARRAATTAKPVATTKKPVATTAKPVVTTRKPVATTAKPVATTKKPVATTAKPVTTTAKPVTTTASRPTTTAPRPTTTAPRPTTTAPRPTTTAPATTPPTTRPASYTRDQVISIIRSVWPDELEERAIWVVGRESNYIPTARNYCCVGLFALNVQVPQMQTVAASLGFTLSQFTDPVVNTKVAWAVYQRYENIKPGSGWCPWRPLPWSYTCP